MARGKMWNNPIVTDGNNTASISQMICSRIWSFLTFWWRECNQTTFQRIHIITNHFQVVNIFRTVRNGPLQRKFFRTLTFTFYLCLILGVFFQIVTEWNPVAFIFFAINFVGMNWDMAETVCFLTDTVVFKAFLCEQRNKSFRKIQDV